MSLPALALDHGFTLPGGRTARVRCTTVADGDLAVTSPGPGLDERRRRLSRRPWSWLSQVHGTTAVAVDRPGAHTGAEADAAVTAHPGALLVVHTADCAPIALVGEAGVVGVVHAGWRGLVAGVVETAVERLGAAGAGALRAVVGPCIHASCYAFGAELLDDVAARCGDVARGVTPAGDPALDLPAAVDAVLLRAGVEPVGGTPPCTACDPRFHSYRARGDGGRQAMLVWLEGE